VDDKKKDISQIRKYLNGELDARAMHQLEREAQDDPFLMDAMDGFEKSSAADAFNFDELDQRLADRIGESKVRKLFPWKYYAAAASVLLFFTIGYLMWPKPEASTQQVADLVQQKAAQPDHTATPTDTIVPPTPAQNPTIAKTPAPRFKNASPVTADKQTDVQPAVSQADVRVNDSTNRLAEVSIVNPNQAKTNARVLSAPNAAPALAKAPAPIPDSIKQQYELVARLAPKPVNNYGNANPVRGFVSPKADSIKLNEIVIPGLAKLDPNALATKTAAQPQTLDSKVKDAEVKTTKKGNDAMLSQAGLALNPNLRNPIKKETQAEADGRLSVPTNGQAAADAKAKGYVASRQANNNADEPTGTNATSGYSKVKADNIKQAHPKMGWDAYNKYLKAKAIGSEGAVRVSFSVDAKGQLADFRIIKSVDEATDKKAIDLIKNGPAWFADVSGKVKTIELKVSFGKE